MSTDYNLTAPRTLIGLWSEDRALALDGYATRVYGRDLAKIETFERVMPRCRQGSAAGWRSETADRAAQVYAPSSHPPPPPRAAALANSIKAEAEEHVRSIRPRVERVEALSETRAQYRRWDEDCYRRQEGRGKARAPSPTTGRLPGGPSNDYGLVGDPSSYSHSDLLSEAPITLFSARMPEGSFPFTSFRIGAQAAMGKSSAFTNDIRDATKAHAGALDRPGVVTPLAPSMARGGLGATGAVGEGDKLPARVLAPGSELSLAALFTRVLRRFKAGGLTLEGLLEAAAAREQQENFSAELSSTPADGDFPADAVRLSIHAARLQLQDTDLAAVLACCDPRGDGETFSPALFRHYVDSLVKEKPSA